MFKDKAEIRAWMHESKPTRKMLCETLLDGLPFEYGKIVNGKIEITPPHKALMTKDIIEIYLNRRECQTSYEMYREFSGQIPEILDTPVSMVFLTYNKDSHYFELAEKEPRILQLIHVREFLTRKYRATGEWTATRFHDLEGEIKFLFEFYQKVQTTSFDTLFKNQWGYNQLQAQIQKDSEIVGKHDPRLLTGILDGPVRIVTSIEKRLYVQMRRW